MKIAKLVLTLFFLMSPLFAQWEEIDSPKGGTITQLNHFGDNIFALALNSGIYSLDKDKMIWNRILVPNDLLITTTSFDIDTINKIYYVAVNRKGIFKSIDLINWQIIHNGKDINNEDMFVKKIRSFGDTILFINNNNIFYSSQSGDNFKNINSNLPNVILYDFIFFESKIYLATKAGLFVSEDFGESWQLTNFQGDEVYNLYLADSKLFVTVNHISYNPQTFQIYQKDIASDFFNVYNENTFKNLQVLNFTSDKNRYVVHTAEVDNLGIIYKLFVSNDYGNSWNIFKVFDKREKEFFTYTSLVDVDKIYLGTFYEGIYSIKLKDKYESFLNQGLNATLVNSYFEKNDLKISSTVNSGIYFKNADSVNWQRSHYSPIDNLGNFQIINDLESINGEFYAATDQGLYKATDGINWKYLARSETSMLDIEYTNNIIYALGNNSTGLVFTSTDLGTSWAEKVLPNNAFGLSFFVDANIIYVGSNLGLFKSVDGGNNWELINSEFTGSNYIRNIRKLYDNSILINSNNKLYKSLNNGYNWVLLNLGESNILINNVVSYGNTAILSTSVGTLFTYDYGESWSKYNIGLESLNIRKVNKIDTNLYAFQTSGGIYRTNLVKIAPIKIISPIERIICKLSDFQLSYEINPNIEFKIDNKFYVELSNENGVFDKSSKIIGELNSTTNGIINVNIGEDIISSNKYRFRIVATSPQIVGIDNQYDISITTKPMPQISGELNVCTGSDYIYNIDKLGSFFTKWSITNGEIIGDNDKEIVNVRWLGEGQGTLKVELTGNSLCNGEGIISVDVFETPIKPIIQFDGTKLISNYDSENQWYYEGTIIEGANQKEFTPINDGNYAVRVSNNYCYSEFSDIFNFKNQSDKLIFNIDTIYSYTGDDVWINIRLIKNQKYYSMNIEKISFDLVFNGSILYPKDDKKGIVANGLRILNLETDNNFINNNILTSLPMKVMLGNADKTNIEIQNIKINNQNFDEYVVNSGMLYLMNVCYDGGPRLITSEPFIQIEKISPNPITSEFELSIYSSDNQSAEIMLTDIFGNKVESLYYGNLDKGLNSINMKISNNSIGDYFILAKSKLSNSIYKIVLSR